MLLTDLNVMFTACTLGTLTCDCFLSKSQSCSVLSVTFHKSFACCISKYLGLYLALIKKLKSFSKLIINKISLFLLFFFFCSIARKDVFTESAFCYLWRIHWSSDIFVIHSNVLSSSIGCRCYSNWCVLISFSVSLSLLHLPASFTR